MGNLDKLKQFAHGGRRIVVLAEAADERMIRAADILLKQNIARPVLSGNEDEIRSIARNCNVALDSIAVVDPARDTQNMDRYIANCATIRRPLTADVAYRQMLKPLMYSAMMVRSGDADAMIAGSSVTTARVIEAGLVIIGTAANTKTASSFFLMMIPDKENGRDKLTVFADCAVNINPNSTQLAEITCTTARNASQLLDEEPRIAMLSFSTHGSAQHELIDKVTEALTLARERLPGVMIDGELQFDAAFDRRTASLKLDQSSEVAGRANVFIFPDLNSGNIGYKIAQYIGGAQAIGPILQGFAKPISDLSRGATVDDIVTTTSVMLAISATETLKSTH